jgi:hypothetical protein
MGGDRRQSMRQQLLMGSGALILTCIQVGISGSAIAEQFCKDKNKFVGSCFSVQGKLFVSNGTPSVRIVPKGSKRSLGIVNDGDAEDRTLPDEVAIMISTETHIYGRFEVCPLTKPKPDEMRMVCLISGKNLVARKIQ